MNTNSYRFPMHLPDCVKQPEAEGRLSDAYSSLKDIHIELKRHYSVLKRDNKQLKAELEDYKNRYTELIRQINADETNNSRE